MVKSNYVWMFDRNSGGVKIPAKEHKQIHEDILQYVSAVVPEVIIDVKFRGQFCYLGTIEGSNVNAKIIMPVCRLRHFRIDNWSIALYSYGSDKYEPCILDSGKWDGSLEEALKIGNLYLLN